MNQNLNRNFSKRKFESIEGSSNTLLNSRENECSSPKKRYFGNGENSRTKYQFHDVSRSLQKIVTMKTDDEVVLKLLDPSLNMKLFLKDIKWDNREEIKLTIMATLKAENHSNLIYNFRSYINLIIDSDFGDKELNKLILKEITDLNDPEMIQLIVLLLRVFYKTVPERAYKIFYVESKAITRTVEKHSQLSSKMSEIIEDIKALAFLDDNYDKNKFFMRYLYPPNDFRQIPVIPTADDLLSTELNSVFLRSNKVKGAYKSVDDYLDVQFRLMREDFMQPLREGIMHCMSKSNKKKLDIRIYKDVTVLDCRPSNRNGIIHRLQLNATRLKYINWAESKRFIYGSLLCLSSDNFQTIFCATIVERDNKSLSKGIVTVKFESSTFDRTQVYTLLETTNLFESYRHVLIKLQNTNEDNLPLKNYLVYGDTNMVAPLYCKEQNMEYEIDKYLVNPFENEPCWPSADDFLMDEAQFEAFKSALTSQLTIIQGPPGTGKTYLGLKICKTLIKNICEKTFNFGPILVVCYTNHALDQFLEGINRENVTSHIVRIGSRSKSKVLEKYQLHNVKMNTKFQKTNKDKCFKMLRECSREFTKYEAFTYLSRHYIFKIDILSDFMSEDHIEYFQRADIIEWLSGKTQKGFVTSKEFSFENYVERFLTTKIGKSIQQIVQDSIMEYKRKGVEESDNDSDIEVKDMEYKRARVEESDNDSDIEVNYLNKERMIDYSDADDKFDVIIKAKVKNLRSELCCSFISLYHGSYRIRLDKTTKMSFETKLRRNDVMSEDELDDILSLSFLSLKDRWRLYRYWVSLYKAFFEKEFKSLEEEFENVSEQLKEITFEEDRKVMKIQDIIGMTTTGAARYSRVLSQIQCKIIIVEEAAEVLESHIIGSLNEGCEHLILIGDHKQLKPNPAVYDLAKKYQLDLSLFERLINNNLPYNQLVLQYRMRPEIAQLMKHIYPNLENHTTVLNYPNVPGLKSNIFFLDHREPEIVNEEMVSYSNKFEVEFIVGFCRRLLDNGIRGPQITILTLYSGQMFLLRKSMKERHLNDIRICVVDNYQGEENDIILLSLVRSNEEGKIGFLKTENRICVSLSRARHGLFVFGNFEILEKHSQLWRHICEDLRNNALLGSEILLTCQKHSFKLLKISKPSDFEKYTGGGCDEICNQELSCKHKCKALCHFNNADHKENNCSENCERLCPNGHSCKLKCSVACRQCVVPLLKTIPDCNHTQMMACYVTPSSKMCNSKCERVLSCGHSCSKTCREICDPCTFMSTAKCLECDKRNRYKCGEVSICRSACTKRLSCNHTCRGNCNSCNNQRLHTPCTEIVTSTLVCGHSKNNECFSQNNYCNFQCVQGCFHGTCSNECGEECINCMKDCKWNCAHFQCTNRCYEFCNRPFCDNRCNKLFKCINPKCGNVFRCYGVCGEKCMNKCSKCDPSIGHLIRKYGSNAKFITLLTCGHTFECKNMDKYMEIPYEKGKITLKQCSKCHKVITNASCFRYSNLVKLSLMDVKRVQKLYIDNVRFDLFSQFCVLYNENRIPFYEMVTEFELRNYFYKFEQQEMKTPNFTVKKCNISFRFILDIYNHFFQAFKDKDKLRNYEYIRKSIVHLLNWLNPFERLFDKFEMEQFYSEFDRINMLIQVSSGKFDQILQNEEPNIINKLMKTKDSSLKSKENIKTHLNIKEAVLPELDLTSHKNKNPIESISLYRDAWYKCRKGHFYSPDETSKSVSCPKC